MHQCFAQSRGGGGVGNPGWGLSQWKTFAKTPIIQVYSKFVYSDLSILMQPARNKH